MSETSTSKIAKAPKSSWWRTVLGEYPTGVSLISSVDTESGDHIGMVVGTFSAVSEDPPLISFMATKSSYNYGRIMESKRFTASILGAGHEDLCRAFARGSDDRFAQGNWSETQSGLRRLSDAVAWFDAEIIQSVEAGDHDIVIARVTEFGVGNGDAGMPLLFLKGGYGSFTVPKLEFSALEFGEELRLLEVARAEVDSLAERLKAEAFVATVAKDSVVVLARANVGASSPTTELIGQAFPFAAPVASVFVVWSAPERVKLWEENSRHLLGEVNRTFLADLFDRVKSRGYAVTVGDAMDESFDRIVGNPEAPHSEISQLWHRLAAQYVSLTTGDDWHTNVAAMQVPIFSADATTRFELFVTVPTPFDTADGFDAFAQSVLAAAARMTQATGGVFPAGYPIPVAK